MPVHGQEHILVIEDDPDLGLILQARLAAAGYTVHIEASGACALAYAVQHRADLAIVDLQLPDLDGYEVCQELHQVCRGMRVLIFSVLDDPAVRQRSRSHGADAYLPKSCSPSALLHAVEQLTSSQPPNSRFADVLEPAWSSAAPVGLFS